MSHDPGPKSILLLDNDLGFVIWAGHILAEAGYWSWPATTVIDALKWAEELQIEFRFLLVDPCLSGAADLIKRLRELYPRLKVVSLSRGYGDEGISADAVVSKPTNFDDPDAAPTWAVAVARVTSEHLTG